MFTLTIILGDIQVMCVKQFSFNDKSVIEFINVGLEIIIIDEV